MCLLLARAEEDDHDDHDHDQDHGKELPYEWAGIFETDGDNFVWLAQKVDGKYVDPGMKLAALPASEASKKKLDALATEGEHSLEETCTELHAGETIVPKEHACYQLHFDEAMPTSIFKVDASGSKAIAFFAEHVPTEFERDAHYFKDTDGADVEPAAELPEADAESEATVDWGGPIAASIIVNIVTFSGVVFMIPALKKLSETYAQDFQSIVSAFAAGAILSCAFYLLLFEATHLIATGWDEEVDVLWRWGTSILAGFSLPVVTQTVASALASEQADKSTTKDPEGSTAKSVVVSRSRIMSGVLIGDFFHNVCDGFFMGAAFKGCGSAFGWKVLIGTAAHELAQELADYLVLTGPDAQLRPVTALAMNFVSGLGVLLGTVVIMGSEVGNDTIGVLLAFGGGVYLHVAATECMPRVYSELLSLRTRIGCLAAFFVGTIGIGLVLLDHEHCVPEGHAHGH